MAQSAHDIAGRSVGLSYIDGVYASQFSVLDCRVCSA